MLIIKKNFQTKKYNDCLATILCIKSLILLKCVGTSGGMQLYVLKHAFISSPEPKAQGELLVSKGDAPASIVMRQQSSSPLKLLGRFTSNLVCSILVTVTLEFAHVISIGPFKGSTELKIEKPLNIFYYRTN
jgi:hypothetical protein